MADKKDSGFGAREINSIAEWARGGFPRVVYDCNSNFIMTHNSKHM